MVPFMEKKMHASRAVVLGGSVEICLRLIAGSQGSVETHLRIGYGTIPSCRQHS